jgi:hypothetical protein
MAPLHPNLSFAANVSQKHRRTPRTQQEPGFQDVSPIANWVSAQQTALSPDTQWTGDSCSYF